MKVSVFFLFALCALLFANAQVIMEPSDRPVALSGTIREVHGFGPPGYGEDKKSVAKTNQYYLHPRTTGMGVDRLRGGQAAQIVLLLKLRE
jgi:hypothetical protein